MKIDDEFKKKYDACKHLARIEEEEKLNEEYSDYLSHHLRYRRSLTDPDARFIHIKGIGTLPYDPIHSLKSIATRASAFIIYFLEVIVETISYKPVEYSQFYKIEYDSDKNYFLHIPAANYNNYKKLKFQIY